MNEIEKVKEKIRKYWFSEHVANLEGNEGHQILNWCRKGDNTYAIKYILSGNTLVVTGDIGDAVYPLPCKANLKNLMDFELHYFLKQLTAHSMERWSFDAKEARTLLDNWYEDVKGDFEEDEEKALEIESIYFELMGAIHSTSSHDRYESIVHHLCSNTDSEWFDHEMADTLSQFGKKIPEELIAYWLGLQMAIDELQDASSEKLSEMALV